MPVEVDALEIDPRYKLPCDGIDPDFKESFITAPPHLGFPTRNHWAFCKGIMGIDPASERITFQPREELVVLHEGVERPLTREEEGVFINAARRVTGYDGDKLTAREAISLLKSAPQMQEIISLDTPMGEDGDDALASFVVDATDRDIEPVTSLIFREAAETVLACISERESLVLKMRTGIERDAPMTLQEIATVFGVTRERVRQIETRAYKKLRASQTVQNFIGLFT